MALAAIGDLLGIFREALAYLFQSTNNKKKEIIEAHRQMNKAFLLTYDYLRNNRGAYKPMPSLADAWNDASAAVMNINKDLGNILYDKSRFWIHPKLIFELNRQDQIVDLERIVDEMERLRMELR